MQSDIYQDRYLLHQKNKKASFESKWGVVNSKKWSEKEARIFFGILENRRSQRIFIKKEVNIEPLLKAVRLSPSSCNRQAICILPVSDQDDKNLLGGLLVGGIGWIHRADKLLLLFADMEAYKSPYEKSFMPYLDAGFAGYSIYLAAEAMNIGACFVNPNIREKNKELFNERFNNKNMLFCGCLAIGYYERKAKTPKKRKNVLV
jgi:nitroreductase